MTLYRFFDNYVVSASSADEFVSKLHKSSIFHSADDACYMQQLSKRAYVIYGYGIRYDTTANFLNDLISCKLVDIVELN